MRRRVNGYDQKHKVVALFHGQRNPMVIETSHIRKSKCNHLCVLKSLTFSSSEKHSQNLLGFYQTLTACHSYQIGFFATSICVLEWRYSILFNQAPACDSKWSEKNGPDMRHDPLYPFSLTSSSPNHLSTVLSKPKDTRCIVRM